MSGAREEILERIRRAYGDSRPAVPSPAAAASAGWDADATLEQFAETTADYRAVVERCSPDELAARVAGALAGAQQVVCSAALDRSLLAGYGGEVLLDTDLTSRQLDEVDAVVTGSALGIAATGTIVLDHSGDQGRRAISLIPDLHVCVIRADQVVPDVPQAVAALRPAVDAGRPLTWISGPSATSDIELDRVEGVHGPRTLHVIIVGIIVSADAQSPG